MLWFFNDEGVILLIFKVSTVLKQLFAMYIAVSLSDKFIEGSRQESALQYDLL